ncbi:MAG: flagellar biosynthetic protein FliO [Myxococcaceae bacterium]
MIALTLAALVCAAAPEAAANTSPPTSGSAADAIVAQAFGPAAPSIGTNTADLKVDAPSLGSLMVPGLALAGLAAFAWAMRKRRRAITGQGIQVLEATSLGDKRSLVIADVLGERLVLAVSEAGVAVLMSKPAPATEPEVVTLPPASNLSPPAPRALSFFDRLRGRSTAPAFDAALQESVEDQELRAKLAAGVRSVVP